MARPPLPATSSAPIALRRRRPADLDVHELGDVIERLANLDRLVVGVAAAVGAVVGVFTVRSSGISVVLVPALVTAGLCLNRFALLPQQRVLAEYGIDRVGASAIRKALRDRRYRQAAFAARPAMLRQLLVDHNYDRLPIR